jgi:hypothetical protein
MSKHRVLSLKPQLRLEWRGQDGQNETEQPDHFASLGDSITSSTQIRFSVHTGPRQIAARAMYKIPPINEQRAKPDQEHSGPLNLSLSRRGALCVVFSGSTGLKLVIIDAKGTIRAQAKPTTNMPEVITKTRSIDLGCSRPQIKSKCLERLSSRYV